MSARLWLAGVAYSRSSTPCGGGNFSTQVTFGANLASVGRTVVRLALVARSATSMSSGRFYVHLVPGYQAVARPLGDVVTGGELGLAGARLDATSDTESASPVRIGVCQ